MLAKQLFSGRCICGHHITNHKSMMIADLNFSDNNPWVKIQGGNYYFECMICDGYNGMGGSCDEGGSCCGSYLDIEDPVYLAQTNPTD
jgi:hypothetical protein